MMQLQPLSRGLSNSWLLLEKSPKNTRPQNCGIFCQHAKSYDTTASSDDFVIILRPLPKKDSQTQNMDYHSYNLFQGQGRVKRHSLGKCCVEICECRKLGWGWRQKIHRVIRYFSIWGQIIFLVSVTWKYVLSGCDGRGSRWESRKVWVEHWAGQQTHSISGRQLDDDDHQHYSMMTISNAAYNLSYPQKQHMRSNIQLLEYAIPPWQSLSQNIARGTTDPCYWVPNWRLQLPYGLQIWPTELALVSILATR